mgnify:CR=1 FL=1
MRGLRKIKSRWQKRAKRLNRPERRRLGFQTLELRRMLAGDIGVSDGYLNIVGTEYDDAVDLFVEGDQVVVSMAEYGPDGELSGSDTQSFDQSELRGISFQGIGGDDVFVNDTSIPAVALGGAGDDVMIGGDSRDVLHGGQGDDWLLGNGDRLMGGSGENAILELEKPDLEFDVPIVEPVEESIFEATPELEIDAQFVLDVQVSVESTTDAEIAGGVESASTIEMDVAECLEAESTTETVVDESVETESTDDSILDTQPLDLPTVEDVELTCDGGWSVDVLAVPILDVQPVDVPIVEELELTSDGGEVVDVMIECSEAEEGAGDVTSASETEVADEEQIVEFDPVSSLITHMGVTMTSSVTFLPDVVEGWSIPSISGTAVATFGPESFDLDVMSTQPVEPFAEEEAMGWISCAVEDVEPTASETVGQDTVTASGPAVDTGAPNVDVEESVQDGSSNVDEPETVEPVQEVSNDDILVGGEGRDLIFGGLGDDLLFGDQLDDELTDLLLAEYLGSEPAA